MRIRPHFIAAIAPLLLVAAVLANNSAMPRALCATIAYVAGIVEGVLIASWRVAPRPEVATVVPREAPYRESSAAPAAKPKRRWGWTLFPRSRAFSGAALAGMLAGLSLIAALALSVLLTVVFMFCGETPGFVRAARVDALLWLLVPLLGWRPQEDQT